VLAVNPFGPVQWYVAPETSGVDNDRSSPTHRGELLAAVGVEGTGLTVIVKVFEVAGLPVTQVAFEVITTDTISPLTSVAEVKVLLLVPTLTPFTFH
jgi:hypothetical protein